MLGTLGGGVITSGLSWRWTMLVLVVIGTLVLAGALTLLSGTPDPRVPAQLDVPGAVLASVGLFALVYGITTPAGWAAGLAVVCLSGFLVVERRHPAPLIPLRLNRPAVKWGGPAGLVTLGMYGGTTVLLSLYMQDVLGYSPLATGTCFLAEGLTALVAGLFTARRIGAYGKVRILAAGLAVQGLGTAAMVLLPASGWPAPSSRFRSCAPTRRISSGPRPPSEC
ncbi:MFS transporter [Nonomuraea sp. NPDC049419]|uniref:MFS transporter n=1 Tax=Nonomuraea sp. NPDC049419 TaxID=3155772 RepID=UPI00344847E1